MSEIKPGQNVKAEGYPSTIYGTVMAVCGDQAWVRWAGSQRKDRDSVWPVESLSVTRRKPRCPQCGAKMSGVL